MGKYRLKDADSANGTMSSSQKSSNAQLDPTLAALFKSTTSSAPPQVTVQSSPSSIVRKSANHASSTDVVSSADESEPNSQDEEKSESLASLRNGSGKDAAKLSNRKRKRAANEEDIEDLYMRQLERTDRKRPQRQSAASAEDVSPLLEGSKGHDVGVEDEIPSEGSASPRNGSTQTSEALQQPTHIDVEKAARTVFLGNVSTQAIVSKTARRQLMTHLSFSMPADGTEVVVKVESLRFRSTPFAVNGVPKRASFATQELMDATTPSTNAYAVYTSAAAAREAVRRLNATIILDRHLRVDSVAHPAIVDHHRCVFVGNLDFVSDTSQVQAAMDAEKDTPQRKRKPRPAADVEEGLWRQMGKAGIVESVRVVRDSATRVSKGIAYVQFKDATAVERALAFDGQKFPPLLPRSLRVSRARKISKKTQRMKVQAASQQRGNQPARPRDRRTEKLLGRSAAHQQNQRLQEPRVPNAPSDRAPEGRRASAGLSTHAAKGKKKSGQGKQGNRPRRTKRSAAFRQGEVKSRS